MLDWSDLRYFLAVARTGSTLAAGRTLRVSQTTAARRVAALEEEIGLALFDRRQAGYALTPAGAALLAKAEAVEAAAGAFADAAAAEARDTGGVVRFTVDEIYAVTILAPILRDLIEAHPEIRIELDETAEAIDLAAGTADVALRIAHRPKGSGLVGRRIGDDIWAIYCSRSYAAARGQPQSRRNLQGHPFIGGGGEKLWKIYGAWLRANGLENAVTIHHNSLTGLLADVRSGFGLAVLPCLVADNDPDLVRCLPPAPSGGRSMWLLTHERLRHTPRVRIVTDFLYRRLKKLTLSGPEVEVGEPLAGRPAAA
ncbi:MAG: LysR family transcriptional regulator [Allosphingosinicella sp.]